MQLSIKQPFHTPPYMSYEMTTGCPLAIPTPMGPSGPKKPTSCEECYRSKKSCSQATGQHSCQRCTARSLVCYLHVPKPNIQKGRIRGFYRKTLVRAETDLMAAQKRRIKYCNDRQRKTGSRPSALIQCYLTGRSNVPTPQVAPSPALVNWTQISSGSGPISIYSISDNLLPGSNEAQDGSDQITRPQIRRTGIC
jgi:hypothetical protein